MRDGFLSPKEVCQLTSLSRGTLDRMVKVGTFPAPIWLTPGRLGFHTSEVESWIAEQRLNGRKASDGGTLGSLWLALGFLMGGGSVHDLMNL